MDKKAKGMLWRLPAVLLICAVLGCGLYSRYAAAKAGERLAMPFGIGAAVVLSGSMEPVLSVDDLVFIRKTDRVSEGDVIVYERGNGLVIHRIIAIDGDTITTQGDANNVPDDPVERSEVTGIMIGRIPAAGRLVQFARTPVGVMILLAAAAFLFISACRGEEKEEDDRLDELKEEVRKLKEEAKKESQM